MPGGEVVEAHDLLPEPEQRLDEMRADETRAAGHEPAARIRLQFLADEGERVHGVQSRQTLMPRASKAVVSCWHFTSTSSPPAASLAR
ncbi:MAG: hypothetical protein H6R20_1717 [Proteobacteria bacterium]|nr:hypothetical protein [Pseudomonadota bacterium]